MIFHAQDPMPKSFGEWLTTFTQVQKVPGATGLWCRAFFFALWWQGNTMIVVIKWDPFEGNQISSLNEW